jgi:alkylated DNA repair dioxygenase AlkB
MGALHGGRRSATIEHMFLQASLWSAGDPAIVEGAPIRRTQLDDRSWVDHAPGWLDGSDVVFETLERSLAWRQRRDVPMYDRLVDEPRLTSWWRADEGAPEPMPVLADVRAVLAERYDVDFDSIGFNLYRDGADSVAWHGDRHRHHVVDPVVAIISVGARRPFRLRPRAGAAGSTGSAGATGATAARRSSRTWELGRGDLLVMGGACQHDWEHGVPKVRSAGPRISITYRHGAQRSARRARGRAVGAAVP